MSVSAYTFPYSREYHPSVPVIEIKFHVPGRTPSDRTYVALVDSGSDGTIPKRMQQQYHSTSSS